MVITEFDAGDPEATMHAMVSEILRYRHCVRQLADAIGWTSTGAPFGLIRPGPDVPTPLRGTQSKSMATNNKTALPQTQ